MPAVYPRRSCGTSAQVGEFLHDAREYGFSVDAPTFDWRVVKDARDRYVERLNEIYSRNLDVAGIDRIEGFARFVGPRAVEVNGGMLEANRILIATGGAPDVPDCPGAELGISSDGFFALENRPECVAIVGAGYIAVELAGIFCALGSQVTLILRNESFLCRFDRMLRDRLLEIMTEKGVSIITSTHLQSVTREGGELCLLDHKGNKMTGYDSLIWAIGRSPNSRGIGLEKLGIQVDKEGYIQVDEYENTSVVSKETRIKYLKYDWKLNEIK